MNVQNAADALQKFNLKKAAVQKALDTLCDCGKISFKEYGKQKIYMARQDQFDIPDSEELNRMKEQNANLQKELDEQKKATSEVEAGVLNRYSFAVVCELLVQILANLTILNYNGLLQK